MLRSRIFIAIFASLILIAVASWQRFGFGTTSAGSLVVINQDNVMGEDFLIDVLNDSTDSRLLSPPREPETLTKTDAISRQLFAEYLESSSQGLTSPADLQELGSKYADLVLAENVLGYQPALINEIRLLPDTEENLKNYGQKMLQLRAEQGRQAGQLSQDSTAIQSSNRALEEFFSEVAELYTEAGKELKKISVPQALAGNHLAIINIYLENAEISRKISKMSADPLVAVSAMSKQNVNSQKEEGLFANIQLAMMANGVGTTPGI